MELTTLLSLTKISCTLLATIGLQITVTPPHPPPAKSDEAPSTRWEAIVRRRGGPMIIKFICWFAAFAEISLICAQTLGYEAPVKGVLGALGIHKETSPVSSLYLPPMFLVGTCLAVVGGYIRHCCYQELGHLFTFEMSIMKEHKLITTGPYGLVRHPAYTGLLCTILGIILLHGASGSWLMECRAHQSIMGQSMIAMFLVLTSSILIGLLKRIPKEDEALEDKFGRDWRSWAERVPYRLFWGIY